MFVVGTGNNPVVCNIGRIDISATGVIDVVLDTVVAGDVPAFYELGGYQHLTGVTDGADHLPGGMEIGNELQYLLVLPHVLHRLGAAGKQRLSWVGLDGLQAPRWRF